MSTYLAGFTLGLSLILAIGSQNAFVLKQGLKRQHVFIVCLVCALSDAILISFGVAGFGAIIKQYPSIEWISRYAGALFLFVYAFLSIKSAIVNRHALSPTVKSESSVVKVVAMCMAFTWLNPHVYLDTVVLLGSISSQYQPNQFQFAVGAISGSFIFFFSLGYGARTLAPIFEKPRAWTILEFVVGIMMLSIGVSLIL
ncbi:LysE/ArgO family amino acid transporter [Vibrio profundi]|uniref:LysE/ArgO family amino acid transporter n=1 Tax=Vibrio profundi TaxID=1774960 RepID=UPI0037351553